MRVHADVLVLGLPQILAFISFMFGETAGRVAKIRSLGAFSGTLTESLFLNTNFRNCFKIKALDYICDDLDVH